MMPLEGRQEGPQGVCSCQFLRSHRVSASELTTQNAAGVCSKPRACLVWCELCAVCSVPSRWPSERDMVAERKEQKREP